MIMDDTLEQVGTQIFQGSEPGMPVFDKDGILLGTVARACEPADSALEWVAIALEYANIASAIVERIRHGGCLEVYGGARRDYYYVMPDQIAEVTSSGVFLNCSRVALIHL